MAIKDRFEGIVNDGAMTESEAVKTCITYARELQAEVKKLRDNEKESKADRILAVYLHWCRNYAAEGIFFAHIGGGLALVGILWLFGLLVNYMHYEYLQLTSDKTIVSEYHMQGDTALIDGKNVPCYQINFTQQNGEVVRASPCIVNRDEAFSVLAQLQELYKNGKPQTKPEPSPSEATPGR